MTLPRILFAVVVLSGVPGLVPAGLAQAPAKPPVRKAPEPAPSPDRTAVLRRVLDQYRQPMSACDAIEKEYLTRMDDVTKQFTSDKRGDVGEGLRRLGILRNQRTECVEAVKAFARPKLEATGATTQQQQDAWSAWYGNTEGRAAPAGATAAHPCTKAFATRPVTVFEAGALPGGSVDVFKRAHVTAESWLLEHIPQLEAPAEGKPADVTLCIREEFQTTGQTYGSSGPAYRRRWEIQPVRMKDGALLIGSEFSTNPPDSKAAGELGAGPPPYDDVAKWAGSRETPSGSGWAVWRYLRFDDVQGGTSTRMAISRDGRWLSFANTSGFVRLVDAEGGTVHALAGQQWPAAAVAFSPDSQWLAASTEGGIQLVEVATGKVVRKLPLNRGPASLAFSPDGTRLAVGEAYEYKDVNLSFWSAGEGRMLKRVKVNDSSISISELAFSSDGRRLVLGADHRLWIADGEGKVLVSRQACAEGMGVSADGAFVALPNRGASTLCKVELVDGSTGRQIKTLPDTSSSAMAISPDGTLLASLSGYRDTIVRFYDLPGGAPKGDLKVAGGATAAAFSGDGKTLVLATANGLTVLRRTP